MDLRNKTITVGELLDDPRSKAVFQRRFGKLLRHPIHLLSGALYQIFHRVSSRTRPRENPPQRLSFTVGSDRINNTFNNGGTYP